MVLLRRRRSDDASSELKDFTEANVPLEMVEQNCQANKTVSWGREAECTKVHYILLTINCINKTPLRMFSYATLFSYKIQGFLKLCRNSIVNTKSGKSYPSRGTWIDSCYSRWGNSITRAGEAAGISTHGRDRTAE